MKLQRKSKQSKEQKLLAYIAILEKDVIDLRSKLKEALEPTHSDDTSTMYTHLVKGTLPESAHFSMEIVSDVEATLNIKIKIKNGGDTLCSVIPPKITYTVIPGNIFTLNLPDTSISFK